ncbi:MAG: hypothetical protein R6U40_06835 [Desulfobacterales bacterium]
MTSKSCKICFAIFAIFILASCGKHVTLRELQNNPAGSIKFQTDQNYIEVYKKARYSLSPSKSFAGQLVQHQFEHYPDLKEAEICQSVSGTMGGPLSYRYYAVIKSLDKNNTSVNIIYSSPGWKNEALKLKDIILSR